FYAEAGGQVGDHGVLAWSGGKALVLDTVKGTDGVHRHRVSVKEGALGAGQEIEAAVDESRREAIARHHTATHLLHAALRDIVGKHVAQAGSLVEPTRLRFDFSHTSSLSPEEIRKIERLVSQKILEDSHVRVVETTLEEARALGAMALFDEKYAERVRMVEVEGFSRELCGGTHVGRTGEIGLVKILSEEAVGTGLRRIEAVAGLQALELLETLSGEIRKLSEGLKVEPAALVENVKRLQDRARELEKQVESLSGKLAHKTAEVLVGQKEILAGIPVVLIPRIPEPGSGKELADSLREMAGSGLIVLGDVVGGAPVVTASVTQDLVTRGVHAGQIVKLLTAKIGGKGGGRPNFATGGGGDPSLLSADLLKTIVLEALEGLTAKQGKG
ncbi:MAG: alanine--tRNA ligase, partial [Armatimonadetes bacterium]|nr:alanine--tRNA ligase [Armatimonadota bacterium]